MRILIVEDERKVAAFLSRGLSEEGHAVAVAADGLDALALAEQAPFDLAILDVMLPGLDGHHVCRSLRAQVPDIGIVMLSARGELADRVKGLSAGADDYVCKPFSFEELLLRVKALERRMAPPALGTGALRLDPLKLTLWAGETAVALTPREAALVAVFLAHRGETLTRERLAALAWDTAFDTGTNHVDVYVAYVRKKLAGLGLAGLLQTVRGEGYRLEVGP